MSRICQAGIETHGAELYEPLNKDDSSIRLLQLYRSTYDGVVRCHLRPVSIDHAQTLRYTAISYAWGEWENTLPITINGHKIDVHKGLSNFLANLCSSSCKESQYFWIDSLCINQSNTTECAQQSLHMVDIYSRASEVIVLVETAKGWAKQDSDFIPREPVPDSLMPDMSDSKVAEETEEFWAIARPCQTRIMQGWGKWCIPNTAIRCISHSATAPDIEMIYGDPLNLEVEQDVTNTAMQQAILKRLFRSQAAGMLIREYLDWNDIRLRRQLPDTKYLPSPLALGVALDTRETVVFVCMDRSNTVDGTNFVAARDQQNAASDPSFDLREMKSKSLLEIEGVVLLGDFSPYEGSVNTTILLVDERPYTHDIISRGCFDLQGKTCCKNCTTGLTQAFNNIYLGERTKFDGNLMLEISPKTFEMLGLSGIGLHTTVPRKSSLSCCHVNFELVAQLLARWMKAFLPDREGYNDTAFPSYALRDWDILHLKVTLAHSLDTENQSAVETRLADALEWWRLQVKNTFLAWESGKGKDIFTIDLSDSFSSPREKNERWAQWAVIWNTILPSRGLARHFALRSACCVSGSFRALTAIEMFSLATAKILDDDPEWPDQDGNIDDGAQKLMSLCERFLDTDSEGMVQFRDHEIANLLRRRIVGFSRDSHHFLAVACLQKIEQMGSHLLFEPWHDFQSLQARFPSHNYVVTFWQYHYRLVEKHADQLPGQLQMLLLKAWASVSHPSLCQHQKAKIDNFTSSIYSEVVYVGFEFCSKFGFDGLRNIYERMGANDPALNSTPGNTRSPHFNDIQASTYDGDSNVLEAEDWQMIESIDLE